MVAGSHGSGITETVKDRKDSGLPCAMFSRLTSFLKSETLWPSSLGHQSLVLSQSLLFQRDQLILPTNTNCIEELQENLKSSLL